MFVEKNVLTRVILSHITVYILLTSFSNVRFVGWDSLGMDVLFHICTHALVENVMTAVFLLNCLKVRNSVMTNTLLARYVGEAYLWEGNFLSIIIYILVESLSSVMYVGRISPWMGNSLDTDAPTLMRNLTNMSFAGKDFLLGDNLFHIIALTGVKSPLLMTVVERVSQKMVVLWNINTLILVRNHSSVRSYSVSGHLVSHQQAHTREKPFRCNICKKGFSVRVLTSETCWAIYNKASVI